MAIRFDAANEWLTRTASIPTGTNITLCWWARMDVDRDTWQSPTFSLDNSNQNHYWYIQPLNVGGSNDFVMYVNANGNSLWTSNGPTITTTSGWHFLAMVRNGANWTLYWGVPGSGLSSSSVTNGGTYAPNTLRVGDTTWGGEWFNGRIAGCCIWLASLTQAELERQMREMRPIRRANLWAAYPLVGPVNNRHLADASGAQRNLSQGSGGTPTYGTGPPIPYHITKRTVYFASAGPLPGITGDLDVTFDAMTLTSAATLSIEGQSSPTFDTLTLDAAATLSIEGQSTPTFDALTLTSAATLALEGQSTPTFDAMTLASSGVLGVVSRIEAEDFTRSIGGFIDQGTFMEAPGGPPDLTANQLPASRADRLEYDVDVSVVGEYRVTAFVRGENAGTNSLWFYSDATAASEINIVASEDGTWEVREVTSGVDLDAGPGLITIAKREPATKIDWLEFQGPGAVTLRDNTGVLESTLDALTLASTALLPLTGQSTPTFAPATLAASGAQTETAILDVTLAPLTLASTATLAIEGQSTPTLDPVTLSALGVRTLTGGLSAALDGLTLTSSGLVPIDGQSAPVFAPMTIVASGAQTKTANAALTFVPLALASQATMPLRGNASLAFDAMTVTSFGTSGLTGGASLAFDAVTVVGQGVMPLDGVLILTLDEAGLAALGVIPLGGGLSASFEELTLSSDATMLLRGNLASALEDLGLASFGSETRAANAPLVFDDLTITSEGVLLLAGNAVMAFDPLVLAAFAAGTNVGASSVVFDTMQMTSSGVMPLRGNLSVVFDAVLLQASDAPIPIPPRRGRIVAPGMRGRVGAPGHSGVVRT